ncbi:MAG: alpha/beta hydrolase-fold protein [Flavobacteriaceae bacterium]|nr:alpha/beta hydrolase-fold protein [Flavobacteriaceae bacterium]
MNSVRGIKIKLPRNYDENSILKYPVIVVFDGDYLFGPVVGQTDFQTYFDEMPGSIIVGIIQGNERFYDSYYDEVSGLPLETGARFYEFVAQELLPYIDNNYNTSKFKVAVGHNIMGNFINAFLMKDEPLFQAYINLSPDLSGEMGINIAERLAWTKQDLFYYMATSKGDIENIRKNILETHVEIANIDNEHLTYYFDDFTDGSHYTLVTGALTKAFDKIFELYKPLSEKELTEKVAKYDGTLDEYLVKRYKRIYDLFGIEKPITEEELLKVIAVAEERNDLESLQQLGKLALKQDENSAFGTYYLALHAERLGKSKKAVKLYKTSLEQNPTSHLDRDFILSKLEELEVVTQDTEAEDEDIEN